jgi:hypothetical protein
LKGRKILEKLLEFIGQIQSDKRFSTLDEAAIKQGIVLKILSLLDWDPFNIDEIQPEYSVGDGKVEFSLRNRTSAEAFLMVKKEEKKFKGYALELLDYAVEEDVKLAILTNGIVWGFYSTLLDGTSEEKKFHTIDLHKQRADAIAKIFTVFLSKKNVISGKAVKAAENIYRIRQREALLHQHLPQAWQKIMNEPEKWLVDIFGKATKELCGYAPDRETVEKFVKARIDSLAEMSDKSKLKRPEESKDAKGSVQNFKAKGIGSFKFETKEYRVNSWQDMLVKLCELIYSNHKDDFEMVLTLTNQDKEYFSEIQYKFLNCAQIPGTDMYVNTDLAPEDIMSLCREMLRLFGYKDSDLAIESK